VQDLGAEAAVAMLMLQDLEAGLGRSGSRRSNPGIVTPKIPDSDLVAGAGSVDIRQFPGAGNVPAAGVPGTPSNP
jgi:hypothetical protein